MYRKFSPAYIMPSVNALKSQMQTYSTDSKRLKALGERLKINQCNYFKMFIYSTLFCS